VAAAVGFHNEIKFIPNRFHRVHKTTAHRELSAGLARPTVVLPEFLDPLERGTACGHRNAARIAIMATTNCNSIKVKATANDHSWEIIRSTGGMGSVSIEAEQESNQK